MDRSAGTRGDSASLDVRRHAFFFDFDGTLADIAETPDAAAVPAALAGDLARLMRAAGGAAALLSGRPIAVLDRHLDPLRLAACGLHGLEIRLSDGGPIMRPDGGPRLDPARAAFHALAAADPRLIVEDKGLAVALHYRRAPLEEPRALAAAREALAGLGAGVALQPGKMVVELRLEGPDKGAALSAIMAQPAFSRRIPVMFGDDKTDEPAFAAARAAGGLGVHVGSAPAPASASHRLADAASVRGLIARLAQEAGDGG